MDEITVSSDLPDVQLIWRRALVMLLVSLRYDIETRYLQSRLFSDDREYCERIIRCFEETSSLYDLLTPNEKVLIGTEIGQWPTDFIMEYSWHVEAVSCILWALNEFEDMAPHDQLRDMDDIDDYFSNIYHLHDLNHWNKGVLGKNFILRKRSEIEFYLKRSELVYQRCLIAWYIRQKDRKTPKKKYSSLFPLSEFRLPIGNTGDLVVYGTEFCDINQDQEMQLAPMSVIRIQTFRWILSPHQNWDEFAGIGYLNKLPLTILSKM